MAEYPKSITEALHKVMQAVGYVQKKGRNDFHRYNYAGEAHLLEVLRPAMIEAGLLLIPSGQKLTPIDEYGNTHVEVAYTLAHVSGDVWPDKIVAFGSGNDKNSKGGVQDKGTYKALTGANKYLLFKLFQIETGDDPEMSTHEAPPPAKSNLSIHEDANTPKIKAQKGGDGLPLNEQEWKAWGTDIVAKINGASGKGALKMIWSEASDTFNACPSRKLKDALQDTYDGRMQIFDTPNKDELTELDAG